MCRPKRVRHAGRPAPRHQGDRATASVARAHASAASQAARAWSATGDGAFHITMSASPMYLSTVPPVASTAAVAASR